MDLILWRHADAKDGTPDRERPLSAKGHQQAARMAKWLRRHLPDAAGVLVSPARRAQETAAALTRDFRTIDDIGTTATAQAILVACGWSGDDRTVVVVGHQPTLGEVAALLLTGSVQQWSIEKGAVVWIAHRATRARLRAAISPDLL